MIIDEVTKILDSAYFPKQQSVLEEVDKAGRVITYAQIQENGVGKYLSCKLDPNNVRIFPYFVKDTNQGLNSICDYFVFVEHQENLCVLLVELKSSPVSSATQLKASLCFMKFIFATASRLGYEIDNVRLIKVRCRPIQKRTTQTCIPHVQDGVVVYPWNDFRLKAVIDTAQQYFGANMMLKICDMKVSDNP